MSAAERLLWFIISTAEACSGFIYVLDIAVDGVLHFGHLLSELELVVVE